MTTAVGRTEHVAFPSVEWFEALGAAARHDGERYRHLGWIDLRLGVRVGDRGYRLEFSDFGLVRAEEWDGHAPVDCTVAASEADWRELFAHIAARGSADPQHTLNSLVLAGDRFTLSGEDQLGVDAFYRFNATLQAFVEEARHLTPARG
jgi:hypothetical protein